MDRAGQRVIARRHFSDANHSLDGLRASRTTPTSTATNENRLSAVSDGNGEAPAVARLPRPPAMPRPPSTNSTMRAQLYPRQANQTKSPYSPAKTSDTTMTTVDRP